MAEFSDSPNSDYRPVLMKKKIVQLPPDDVLDNADPAIRWLINGTVEQTQILNNIIDSANEQKISVHKGFRRMNDSFSLINGIVGRTKSRVDAIEVEKQRQSQIEERRIDDAERLAKEAKNDRDRSEKFRKKILGRLGWLISTIGIYSGSSIFSKAIAWFPGGFATLLGLLVIGSIIGAGIVGISYGRKQHSTEMPKDE
jgi:hypothetical protein